ncbi:MULTISPECIES: hypothetical protein [unclassified Microcoleus]|uniref:hypothetical protein n=1 Tax=unclassified Microcoleus TaxID=2642155 RepID=UPI002FD6367D
MPAISATLRVSGVSQKSMQGLVLINPVFRINQRFSPEISVQKQAISPARNRRAIAKNVKSQIYQKELVESLCPIGRN